MDVCASNVDRHHNGNATVYRGASTLLLLVANPEYGGPDHQDDQEQNRPGIHGTVGFTGFG
jgi:hypothetical protein